MRLRVLLPFLLVSVGWVFAPPAAEAQCQATADCNACGGPCCGSSGCTWVPRCGAGPNATCAGGNCCVCAACCVLVGEEIYCSCAKCPNNPPCPACPGSFAPVRAEETGVTRRPSIIPDGKVGASVRALPESGLEITALRLVKDRPGPGVTISYTVVNGGQRSISAYVLVWRLKTTSNAPPVELSTYFDSTLHGSPLPPGAVVDDGPAVGAAGGELASVEAEIALVEFTDGERVGTAAADIAVALDTHRRRFRAEITSYRETLAHAGLKGLDDRLREEQAHATECASGPELPHYLFRLLGPERIASLAQKDQGSELR